MSTIQIREKKGCPLWMRFLIKLISIVAVTSVLFTWVFGLYRMTGNYMFPSVKDGDLCVVYKLEDYHINDVVSYKDDNGKTRIGRIVAIEGQSVDFPEEGGYTVDGYHPSEEITYQTFGCEGQKTPIVVPAGSYFIMNDFRSDTNDSRQTGTVERSQLHGKLMFIIRRRGF